MITNETSLKFFEDGGHGWIEVPIRELVRLKIEDKISGYSYMHGEMAYLEEDCDASVLVKSLGFMLKHEVIYENSSRVRTYRPYNYKAYRNAYKINLQRRERNEILRDICGTSARQARIDMGLTY